MRINEEDIRWLGEIVAADATHPDAAIPDYNRSRLCALELIEYKPEGLLVTQRGKALLERVPQPAEIAAAA
jgi:hypothetical protein